MRIKPVFFDVGETLVDESRDWGEWADFLGLSRLAFFGALGAVISRGQHHRTVFSMVRPGVDYADLRRQRDLAGHAHALTPEDFYADAMPCLRALRNAGVLIGIAGNQPLDTEQALRTLGVPADIVASSASWGVEKPDPAFFARIVAATDGLAPSEIAYVGDRLDNDVEPARLAGMVPVFLRRGPWALVQSLDGTFPVPEYEIDSLTALPDLLRTL